MLCLAIFLRLSEHALVDNRYRVPVFLKHGGVFNRRHGLMSPSLIFALFFGVLLSDGGNVFAE
jgi:hypothetical protein